MGVQVCVKKTGGTMKDKQKYVIGGLIWIVVIGSAALWWNRSTQPKNYSIEESVEVSSSTNIEVRVDGINPVIRDSK
jgi:uncharacterized membrane protein